MGSHPRVYGLPVQRTALIGRDRDLATVHDMLRHPETHLVTLTGIGGCGKTRLALRLAEDLGRDYPQRVWLVELAPVVDGDLVPSVVATTLRLREIRSTSPLTAISTFLAARPALLVLDNCEHLIDDCATLADALLSACPDLRIIATSREPLYIAGEHQYRLPPLESPDPQHLPTHDEIATAPAVRLFVTRAQNVLPTFQLTPTNSASVARICDRLGGIPLALELAAARVAVLGVEQILARLDDSFRFLVGGSRVAPTRHQTLRAALDWSDALLSERERTVFYRLAVFAGEFELTATEAVCGGTDLPEEQVLDLLTGLVDKSLVVAEIDDRTSWYHLLEPVRQYALEQLVARAEAEDIRSRHAAFYLERAERAGVGLSGAEQETWLAILERERGNPRAALEWMHQHDTRALHLAVALVPFWEIHGHLTEGLRWLRVLLAQTTTSSPSVLRAQALAGAGRLVFALEHTLPSQYTEAEELTTASLLLARELGDAQAIASALTDLRVIHRLQNDYGRSIACLQDALLRHRELGDEHGTMTTLLHLGCSMYMQGERVTGTRLIIESLDRSQVLRDVRFTATAQVLLGRAAQHQKAFERAIELIAEALTTHSRLGDRWHVTFDLFALAEVLIDEGYSRHGVRIMGAAQASSDRLGSPVGGVSFVDLHQWIDDLRREEWFGRIWTEGYELEPREAIQVARTALDERSAPLQLVQAVQPAYALLTRRELEVARLLAAGYTDRQIADALYLAMRTVGTHVHNILRKLALRSRVEVASWLKTHEPPAPPPPLHD